MKKCIPIRPSIRSRVLISLRISCISIIDWSSGVKEFEPVSICNYYIQFVFSWIDYKISTSPWALAKGWCLFLLYLKQTLCNCIVSLNFFCFLSDHLAKAFKSAVSQYFCFENLTFSIMERLPILSGASQTCSGKIVMLKWVPGFFAFDNVNNGWGVGSGVLQRNIAEDRSCNVTMCPTFEFIMYPINCTRFMLNTVCL